MSQLEQRVNLCKEFAEFLVLAKEHNDHLSVQVCSLFREYQSEVGGIDTKAL